MRNMIKGDQVMVYLDPYTREKPEGMAKLIDELESSGFYDGYRIRYWVVQFQDEFNANRFVLDAPDDNTEFVGI